MRGSFVDPGMPPSPAIKRTQGTVTDEITFHARPDAFKVGDRITLSFTPRMATIVFVDSDGFYTAVLDAPEPPRTGPCPCPCPCGGTWGVCTYHGGPKT